MVGEVGVDRSVLWVLLTGFHVTFSVRSELQIMSSVLGDVKHKRRIIHIASESAKSWRCICVFDILQRESALELVIICVFNGRQTLWLSRFCSLLRTSNLHAACTATRSQKRTSDTKSIHV